MQTFSLSTTYCIYLVCTCIPTSSGPTVHPMKQVWRPEDSWLESVLFSHHGSSQDRIRDSRFGSKQRFVYWVILLASSCFSTLVYSVCMFVYVYIHAFVCMYMHACMYAAVVCMCVYTCIHSHVSTQVNLRYHSSWFVHLGFWDTVSALQGVHWPVIPRDPLIATSPVPGLASTMNCTAGALLTKPSSQPPSRVYLLFLLTCNR